ncbi:hypothetical protein FPV67DRAFT_1666409 [Lyophyllum atratum]|nr:hypothetical protein FPV67DRAFT_1666409 [Lyophyllum atratum]
MEVDTESSAPPSYTLLRIKRKRNEEPLDALVVESRVRRKKSRGIGVFKYAQTVENDVWEDEKRAENIQYQISQLARESSIVSELAAATTPSAVASTVPRPKNDTRHYTILRQDDVEDEDRRIHRPKSPPKIISSRDLPPKPLKPDFQMFDAIRADKETAAPVDSEMDKFLPMLTDYLKLHDVAPDREEIIPYVGDLTKQSDDYVWDVFYHRPATLSEWNAAANVGTLSGLPPSITNPYDSPSDSEEEDEADEDSNAEEYYRNDYPEGDDSSSSARDPDSASDEFHESSDYEEVVHYDEG